MYQIYQVGPNETITSIANKLNISVDELRKINGIGENFSIVAGSYIIIPSNSNMDNEEYIKYVIKPGDNIYSIARDYNIDFETLLNLNGLNKDDYIYPSQEILIPKRKTYITKDNDTIKTVLEKLNINEDKIRDLYLIPDQIILY